MDEHATDVWEERSGGSLPPWAGTAPGGAVLSGEDLLDRSLTFSGSHESDDGQVRIRRATAPFEYAGARLVGSCAICARAGLTAPTGERLPDLHAAAGFLSAHDHGDID